MIVLATDLDRTLLPNGSEKYDNSLPAFNKFIRKKKVCLIYVTGRNIPLIKSAKEKYGVMLPDYAISNVGTRIYKVKNGKFVCDHSWSKEIRKNTQDWDIEKFKMPLKNIKGLFLQEKSKQDIFKLSYYVDLKKSKSILREVKKKIPKSAVVIYSVDFPQPRGLLDILPKSATKVHALDFIVGKLKEKREVVCCGDSGNDLPLLTSSYKAILVKNASSGIKKEVKKIRKERKLGGLYVAKGKGKYNGNYVSGILEGLEYFKLLK